MAVKEAHAIIRNDADTSYVDLIGNVTGVTTTGIVSGAYELTSSALLLYRFNAGYFKTSGKYNSTSYNRGWVTLKYWT